MVYMILLIVLFSVLPVAFFFYGERQRREIEKSIMELERSKRDELNLYIIQLKRAKTRLMQE